MSRMKLALLTTIVLVMLFGCGKKEDDKAAPQTSPTTVEVETTKTPDKQDADEVSTVKENDAKDNDAANTEAGNNDVKENDTTDPDETNTDATDNDASNNEVTNQDGNDNDLTNPDATNNASNENLKELVCDRWADSGSFKMYISDEDFYDFAYAYSVPQIIDDTEDATAINDLITSLFEDMHNTMQKAATEGKITAEEFDSVVCLQTTYDCYWNGSIASIVIASTSYYDDNTQYNIFNYDFESCKQLSNEEMFAIKGITSEKFVENLRRAAVYALDAEMGQFFEYEMPLNEGELWCADLDNEGVQQKYVDYLMARAKTINSDNINENLPVFLDEQGELQAVTPLFRMGMYDGVTNILSPREWVNNGANAYNGDLLDVISKDDGIYLTIYKDDWSLAVFEEFPNFDFAKEYKINGLYKNYIDAKISWVGNGNQPYIILLSDDGMISYVDIWEGIASGYFSAVEPLWSMANIKAFSEDEAYEYRVVAERQDGKLVDVEDALYMILNCKYIDFEKQMLNLGNVTRYSATVNHNESGQDTEYWEMIGFTEDEYGMFVREYYKTDTFEGGSQEGYITFNGMNEKGMVFCFALVGEDGELRGTMAMNAYSYWDEENFGFVDGADVTWLGGFDIFESNGNKVMLESSVGQFFWDVPFYRDVPIFVYSLG